MKRCNRFASELDLYTSVLQCTQSQMMLRSNDQCPHSNTKLHKIHRVLVSQTNVNSK